MEDKYKFYLTASIDMCEETEALKKEAASVITLPTVGEKQPDLSYFSAILVSSGENLNHAYFLGSELVAAAGTIVSKALDVEHEEQDVIGHLFSYAFTDEDHNELNLSELASKETATLDSQDMHIQVGSIVYKNRFPELAKEIANNEWKVSMECYYKDFDIKVGEVIIPKAAATALGIEVADETIYGKSAKVVKDGKEIAEGTVARVLRGICFSGCGIVKNPANPPSVIIETASEEEKDTLLFNLDLVEEASNNTEKSEDNNVTSKEVETKNEKSDLCYNDSVGICVSYKKRLTDKDGNVTAEDWCSEYSQTCTSFSRDAHDQGCLRNTVTKTASAFVDALLEGQRSKDNTAEYLERLEQALSKATKLFND